MPADHRSVTLLLEFLADRCAPPALPDDGIMQRPAGLAVEHDDGFSLVRDAQAGELGYYFRVARRDFADDGEDIFPDFFRVVFHPAGLRINLAVRLGRLVQHPAFGVKKNGLRRGRALVNGEDVFHDKSSGGDFLLRGNGVRSGATNSAFASGVTKMLL